MVNAKLGHESVDDNGPVYQCRQHCIAVIEEGVKPPIIPLCTVLADRTQNSKIPTEIEPRGSCLIKISGSHKGGKWVLFNADQINNSRLIADLMLSNEAPTTLMKSIISSALRGKNPLIDNA
jgi:hypothetical protein